MKGLFGTMGIALMVFLSASAGYAGVLNDSRDSKTCWTMKIGKQMWMAENLNFEYKRKG